MSVKRLLQLIKAVPDLSGRAFALATALLMLATLLREGFSYFGASINFATFYPAVLAAALVCGPYAAAALIPAAMVVVWWAFLLPEFAFQPLTTTNISNFGLFVVTSSTIVFLGHCCRVLIRELEEKDRHRDLLVQELDHRGRNNFAVMDSIIRATLKERPDLAETLTGRTRALSRANDIVYHSETMRVSLRKLIAMKTEQYEPQSISLTGDELELDSKTARALTLVLHELLTNAHKYGALKSSTGRLAIHWMTRGDRVELEWTESGAAEPVKAPDNYGFGSRLIEGMLRDIAAEIKRTFAADGLRCVISFASAKPGKAPEAAVDWIAPTTSTRIRSLSPSEQAAMSPPVAPSP